MDPGELPVVFRPRRLRRTAVSTTAALCLAAALGWLLLPPDLRAAFSTSQLVTLLLILAGMVFALLTLAASSVRADARGLRLRNGLRTHTVAWDDVHKIILRRGDPWAIALITPDDRSFEIDIDAEKRSLMGIQATDGALAEAAVRELRRRHRDYRSQHPAR